MKSENVHVESDVCCQQFLTPGIKKLSLKIIVTDYYDGPTAGLFKCEPCGRVYKFSMVDWDDKQEVRIHALTPMATDSFTRLEELTAKHGPKWWPEGAEVEEVLAQGGNATVIGAFSRWAQVIFAARSLTEADSKDVQEWMSRTNFENGRDWFSFLDIER
jgi:hypothetical protein